MQYQLIIPPIAETQITGFAMAAEKIIGKSHWRLEIWQGENLPRAYKDGKSQESVKVCSKSVVKLSNSLVSFYNQANNPAQ